MLSVLLAFYMLLLQGFPCTDVEECSHDACTKIATDFTTSHSNHPHKKETCSPFCICACCGQVFTQNFHLPKLALTRSVKNLKQPSFSKNTFMPSGYLGNIWQPPKCS